MKKLFVTAIDTNAGKTVLSAIITEALEADYWKPVQAGELNNSDTMKVRSLVSNKKSVFHPEVYALRTPMSPHAAAKRDNLVIDISKIQLPATDNDLVIEGAGGILVPLNEEQCVADLVQHLDAEVVLISRHYLGSINHTLLTAEALKRRGIKVKGIIFNGEEIEGTEEIILKHTGYTYLGHVNEEEVIDKVMVSHYAKKLKAALLG